MVQDKATLTIEHSQEDMIWASSARLGCAGRWAFGNFVLFIITTYFEVRRRKLSGVIHMQL